MTQGVNGPKPQVGKTEYIKNQDGKSVSRQTLQCTKSGENSIFTIVEKIDADNNGDYCGQNDREYIIEETYDKNGNKIESVKKDSGGRDINYERYSYDSSGKLQSADGKHDKLDRNGNVIKRTMYKSHFGLDGTEVDTKYAGGSEITAEHKKILPNGSVTEYLYEDGRKRVVSRNKDGALWANYDKNGHIESGFAVDDNSHHLQELNIKGKTAVPSVEEQLNTAKEPKRPPLK